MPVLGKCRGPAGPQGLRASCQERAGLGAAPGYTGVSDRILERPTAFVCLSHRKPSMLSTGEEKEVQAVEGCSCLCEHDAHFCGCCQRHRVLSVLICVASCISVCVWEGCGHRAAATSINTARTGGSPLRLVAHWSWPPLTVRCPGGDVVLWFHLHLCCFLQSISPHTAEKATHKDTYPWCGSLLVAPHTVSLPAG